ncbi:VWA domain-containing protein [Hydrogenimonas urashimensis]|uniref:VWA domain-containing protein n=1 Tax=Hydrogenimonas urashimensis TaxID=2740515 RepID=UPI001915E672|nr:VWA domain-containing protein [Hydrogenimonas urashimensis]
MTFLYPYFLILILFLVPLGIVIRKKGDDLSRRFSPELYRKMVAQGSGLSRRARRTLLLLAIALGLVALARPVMEKGVIRVKESTVDLVVAFDISRSMFANDLFPNRFELAKRKFFDLLDAMKQTRIGVIGFSSRAFLIAPLTRDYASLKYLVKHMGFDYVTLKGTDMMAPLEVTADLLKKRKKRALLIFTDGGDQKDFSREIAFAKKEGIKVFIYALGTRKGGVMKIGRDVVRDRNGNVVITRLNPAVSSLAEKTGGVYMRFSFSSSDMKRLAEFIRSRLVSGEIKERTIHEREELFYYPLMLSILLFLMAHTSLPAKMRRPVKSEGGERQ